MIHGILIFFLIVTILILCLSFKLLGWLLKLIFFFIIGLPLLLIGAILCGTVIFIPIGMACFKLIGRVLAPFKPRSA